jgi:hypothetical protein
VPASSSASSAAADRLPRRDQRSGWNRLPDAAGSTTSSSTAAAQPRRRARLIGAFGRVLAAERRENPFFVDTC